MIFQSVRRCVVPLLISGICFVIAVVPIGSLAETVKADQTEVVLVGTLHEYHDHLPNYSRDILRDIIISAQPAAILYEMPSVLDGLPTSVNGRINTRFRDNESVAVNQAADSLQVPVFPYDREGRNEIYVKTRYFEREQYAFGELMKWGEWTSEDPNEKAAAVATGCLFESVQQAQMEVVTTAGPQVLNSSVFDLLSKNKHCLVYELWPALLTSADQDSVIADLKFLNEEWNTRNGIMADNIIRIAQGYVGKRLVVLCGAEHRHDLRELLATRNTVKVLEYYELE